MNQCMSMKDCFIHPLADVQSENIGRGTKIWQSAVVLRGAKIGADCNICANTFIESDVELGDNVCVKCGVYLWDGLRVGHNVFIGPNATFCNDMYPQAGVHDDRRRLLTTIVRDGASIGAGAVILPGITIGAHAVIGAGSVVVRDVPPYAKVVGNPARIVGYVDSHRIMDCPNAKNMSSGGYALGKTGARTYTIPHFGDMRGDLNVLEFERILPFPIRRIFYTYNVGSGEVRGEHAHKECEQVLIAVSGSLRVIVDDAVSRDEFILDNPSVALHIPAGCWGIEYKHSTDCVLLVLASHAYDANDYIRSYDDFLHFKNQGR